MEREMCSYLEWQLNVILQHCMTFKLVSNMISPDLVSLPSPVAPWVQWSNELAREMYIKCALSRLSLEYPDSPVDS